MKKLLCLMVSVIVPWAAHAEERNFINNDDMLGLVAHAVLDVSDGVSGGCWTNSDSIRSKLHLLFAQNGIFVPDYDVQHYNIRTVYVGVSAFGDRHGGSCSVVAQFSIQTRVMNEFGGWGGGPMFYSVPVSSIAERSRLFFNGSNVDDQLEDYFVAQASEFLAKHLTAKNSDAVTLFDEAYPALGKPKKREEPEEDPEN